MILVDSRFGSERQGQRASHRIVAETLPKLGATVELTHLDFGDFAFLGNGPDGPVRIGVELKVVSDLVSSMRSGRLAEQVVGMAEIYGRSYLIVEGLYRASRKNGLLEVPRGVGYHPIVAGPRPVFWRDVQRFLTSIEEAGVRVHHTRSGYETACVIAEVLQCFWDKDYADHKSLQVMRATTPPMALVREDETRARVRRVANALGVGIGWSRSKAVAERFRSVLGLVNADIDQWEAIEGIGKTIARDVFGAVREEIAAQGVSTRKLPQRDRPGARSARDPRQRQNTRVDSGGSTQRRIPQTGAGRRKSSRSESKRHRTAD